MSIQLPELPYPKTALAPHISEETINFHYGKHHKSYVDKLNAQIENTEWKKANLVEIVKSSSGGIFNNAAQVWNHTFYWNSLSPEGSHTTRSTELTQAIERDFDSLENFKREFTAKALGQFGSGWAWLVNAEGTLKVISTSNADTPLTSKSKALLTCDVWEHAYYVDYRNARNSYLEAFWNLVNWDFVSRNLDD